MLRKIGQILLKILFFEFGLFCLLIIFPFQNYDRPIKKGKNLLNQQNSATSGNFVAYFSLPSLPTSPIIAAPNQANWAKQCVWVLFVVCACVFKRNLPENAALHCGATYFRGFFLHKVFRIFSYIRFRAFLYMIIIFHFYVSLYTSNAIILLHYNFLNLLLLYF